MTIHHALQCLRGCMRRGTTALTSHPILTALAVLLLAAATLAQLLPDRYLVLNLSPSVACRLYVLVDAEPALDDLVEFRPEEPFGSDYLCPHGTILKPIAAGPGDHVDTTGEFLFINGERVAPIFIHDSEGRPLPVWRVNRVLESDEFSCSAPAYGTASIAAISARFAASRSSLFECRSLIGFEA